MKFVTWPSTKINETDFSDKEWKDIKDYIEQHIKAYRPRLIKAWKFRKSTVKKKEKQKNNTIRKISDQIDKIISDN